MLSVGLSAQIVKQQFGMGQQEHVLVGIRDEEGRYLYADPANSTAPVYEGSKAMSEEWTDPLGAVGSRSEMPPQMVMLSGAPERDLRRVDGVWTERRYGTTFMHRAGRWQSLEAVGLGSILNWHTVHELSDLVNALQFQVDQIDASYNEAKSAWSAADNAGFLAWETAYNTALAVWVPARTRAQAVIAATAATGNDWDWMPTIEVTGEDSFESVAKAFMPFEELDRELRSSKSFPKPDLPVYAGTPQPTAPDFDLTTYQIADSTWQKIKQVGDSFGNAIRVSAPWLLVGGVAIGLGALWYYAPPRRRAA
jgi:hypothetical protein